MTDATHTPTSPPAPPVVPVGLSTQVGLVVAAILGLIAGVTSFLEGDHTEETVTLIAGSVVVLYGVIKGRMDQAAAAFSNPNRPELL